MSYEKYIFLCGLSLLVLCCTSRHLEPAAYRKWVQDNENGLLQERQIEDIVFRAQYKPADYVILREYKDKLSDSLLKARREELKGMHYLDLKLSVAGPAKDILKYGVSTENELYQRMYYFSFGFQDDLYLLDGEKKIPCSLYHFERSYDMAPERTFVLGFAGEEADNGKDLLLVIDSPELGVGTVKLRFSKDNLNSIPELKP